LFGSGKPPPIVVKRTGLLVPIATAGRPDPEFNAGLALAVLATIGAAATILLIYPHARPVAIGLPEAALPAE